MKYFDDDNTSIRKNVLKLNFAPMINGDIGVSYERVLDKVVSVDWSVGFILPYYLGELPYLLDGETLLENPDFGLSASSHLRFYLVRSAPELGYVGVLLRQRGYFQDTGMLLFNDALATVGMQLNYRKNRMYDFFIGFGYRYEIPQSNDNTNVLLSFGFKAGLKI